MWSKSKQKRQKKKYVFKTLASFMLQHSACFTKKPPFDAKIDKFYNLGSVDGKLDELIIIRKKMSIGPQYSSKELSPGVLEIICSSTVS